MVSFSLQGKIVVLTGGDAWPAPPVAAELARQGAVLAVQYQRSFTDARHLVRRIEKDGGQAIAVRAVLSEPAQVEALCRRTVGALGGMDAMVVNAFPDTPPPDLAPPDAAPAPPALPDAYRAVRLPLRDCLVPAHTALRTLSALRRPGALVYLTAGAGLRHALAETAVRRLAAELGEDGLRVNAVAATDPAPPDGPATGTHPQPARIAARMAQLVAALTAGDLAGLSGAVLTTGALPPAR
ncbi:SDR family NAD(P)-dependent oxidoreductase [Streptomyces sp. NPDC006193]|uniref:SDR family NAD(P)-dependent oxidoreductase n=1 Tax=Streptomyces sp. NPDC006193 TaxID=3155717 RepID=UPI0033BE1C55